MTLPPSHGHSVEMSTVGFSRKGAWEFEISLNLAVELLASLLVAMICVAVCPLSTHPCRVIECPPVLDLPIS